MHSLPAPFGPAALSLALCRGADARLATYGSLRPGEQHHGLVAELEVVGDGCVRGDLSEWEGYPVLTPRGNGDPVPVVVLDGVDDTMWIELDAFEGPAYRRDLVIVDLDDEKTLVATCYVAAAP
jgi:gamma-glutamylcyclotransferase (GGCT)/AIG2-like uncharacterized protein YtfP